MNKIIFSFLALILVLNITSPVQSSSFKNNIIKEVKFLDDTEEVEWYRIEGKSLIIGDGKSFLSISSKPTVEPLYAEV
jgi:hypothetical protein